MGLAQALANPIPWIFATFILMIIVGMLIVLLILISKWTHGIKEFKARLKGIPLCLFFDDNKTVEWKNIKPEAGLIQDDVYGTFIINEKSAYVDKTTRNVVLCLPSNVAMSTPVDLAKIADDLSVKITDEKLLGKAIREAYENGELEGESLEGLKTNVNFSSLKSLMNAITPHNLTAKINLEVSKRLHSMGADGQKQLMWFALIGLGLIGFAGLVFWIVTKNDGGATTTIIKYVADNATTISG